MSVFSIYKYKISLLQKCSKSKCINFFWKLKKNLHTYILTDFTESHFSTCECDEEILLHLSRNRYYCHSLNNPIIRLSVTELFTYWTVVLFNSTLSCLFYSFIFSTHPRAGLVSFASRTTAWDVLLPD